MTILPIITATNNTIRTHCEEVPEVNDEVRSELDDMLETMYDAPGIGLAAIQVGIAKRMLVMDISGRTDDQLDNESKPYYIINPYILELSDEKNTFEEGCLSVPGFMEEVERPKIVTVKYLDYNGKEQITTFEGLLATVVQHEIDHLNGVLFIDYLSKLKRTIIMKKIKKAEAT